jgi:hypothetical protein
MMMTDNATQVFKEMGYVPRTEGRLVLRCIEIRIQNRTEQKQVILGKKIRME